MIGSLKRNNHISNNILRFIATLWLSGCSSLENVSWINKPPNNPNYYIGIARVSKNTYKNDYKQNALNTALGFLSSEIKVSVRSMSEDISRDYNGNIDLDFNSRTVTLSNEDLEGYEIVDVRQNSKEYAIYCRLSKTKYLATKRKSLIPKLQQIKDMHEGYLSAIENRNYTIAINQANKLNRSSSHLLKNKDLIIYMTTIELSKVNNYHQLYDNLIADTSVVVNTNEVLPFSWCDGTQIIINLTNSQGQPWNHWQGYLYHDKKKIHTYHTDNNPNITFPISVFAWSEAEMKFQLKLMQSNNKNSIKTLALNIPLENSATLGNIYGKGIPASNKKDLQELAQLFISKAQSSRGNNSSKVEVTVTFTKNYVSSNWISGQLYLTFHNIEVSSDRGTARVEVNCAGSNLSSALQVGVNELRKTLITKNIKWK